MSPQAKNLKNTLTDLGITCFGRMVSVKTETKRIKDNGMPNGYYIEYGAAVAVTSRLTDEQITGIKKQNPYAKITNGAIALIYSH